MSHSQAAVSPRGDAVFNISVFVYKSSLLSHIKRYSSSSKEDSNAKHQGGRNKKLIAGIQKKKQKEKLIVVKQSRHATETEGAV